MGRSNAVRGPGHQEWRMMSCRGIWDVFPKYVKDGEPLWRRVLGCPWGRQRSVAYD